jgi:putative AbiEi antitoxin of type IV toxin-antitoxin system
VAALWSRMETKVLPLDGALAGLAASQHGVVSLAQLLGLGFGTSAIKSRVRSGRLHRIYRAVYAVGHPHISYLGRCMAAVLASGEGAGLSYRAAGQVYGLRTGSWVEVTVPHGRHGPRGIKLHETRRLPAMTVIDGIPVTTLGRTLVDLADVLSHTRLEMAFADAERLRILDLAAIHPISGRKGRKRLEAVLAGLVTADTQPGLEQRFAAFLRDYGFPWPVFNTLVEGILVDVFWPLHKVIVELDSYEYHGKARKPFEDDRAKSNKLQLEHYKVIRVTSRMLDRPDELAAQLTKALSP